MLEVDPMQISAKGTKICEPEMDMGWTHQWVGLSWFGVSHKILSLSVGRVGPGALSKMPKMQFAVVLISEQPQSLLF